MKASVIFTSNDVIANLGVVVAGILVYVFDSPLPDLIIGCIVFYLVTKGAITIFKIH
jgi:Co/Zn/Cd efflux system component